MIELGLFWVGGGSSGSSSSDGASILPLEIGLLEFVGRFGAGAGESSAVSIVAGEGEEVGFEWARGGAGMVVGFSGIFSAFFISKRRLSRVPAARMLESPKGFAG